MATPSRPYYPQLGRHATLGTPHRLEPKGLGSPQRQSPSRSATRVVQPPPATPRAAISVNRLGSNRRTRGAAGFTPSTSTSAQRVNSQMNTLHEIMARDGGRTAYSTRDTTRDSTLSRDPSTASTLTCRDAPSSAFKFRSGMPLDMPMGGYRDGGGYEEDDTITKRRRVTSHVGSGAAKAKNVTWEEDSREDGPSHMIQQLLLQNQRMEEKLSQFERLEEKLDRMDRVESRLLRIESKMDEILRLCR
ncbi:hypothetical protein B0I72DRAFT_133996 [Yarrowia lipolytica]|uniref:Uncharacterized protein n=1 Tax=Yarrowia lipolytica TaxID=4952 RepID=A0A371C2N1_YARLL|nr:hypothetical protein B0I71DRAFT_134083 [Yarrowia lipolytica]RDW34769.1 hypothetical protein B0I72DRAFT_133996 [Yarrowia lipolytica]RDW36264.1 hypothetical protein B0I73DRAFT_137384 [Yarrowia lipolytica]RDW43265.1 hypothetical protein B0I74DRAFT_142359 [Yarrowia lipolytica]RDW50053.1 hypothetical protein B0I75DRAFT_142129 [Yarrowia lipolytica]